MKATGAQHAEPIRLGRLRRSIQLIYDDVPEADMGWQAVLDDIAAATKADPLGRYFELEKQHGNPDPEKRPLRLHDRQALGRPQGHGQGGQDPAAGRAHPAAGTRRSTTRPSSTPSTRSPLHGGLLEGVHELLV